MRSPLALISTSIALLAAAAPGVAAASPIFPGDIQTDLGLSYAPPCTICHNSLAGGPGTVVQPFGMAMKAQKLMLEDSASLQTALNALEALKTDSDCDKIPDIEQLKAGRDPNTGVSIDGVGTSQADMGCMNTGLPAYGCAAPQARVASEPAAWEGAVAVAAALGIALARRRAR